MPLKRPPSGAPSPTRDLKPSRKAQRVLHRRIRDLSARGLLIEEIAYRLSIAIPTVTAVLAQADEEARARRLRMERRDRALAISYRTERLVERPEPRENEQPSKRSAQRRADPNR